MLQLRNGPALAVDSVVKKFKSRAGSACDLSSYTKARVFVLRICVLCAFSTRCTCVEFQLRMKRKSTYFETHEYSLSDLERVSTIKYAFFL